jgi:acetyltransferase-like isoleucine patch superfamily enzyme
MHFSNILSEEIVVGKNVVIEPSAIIRGIAGNAKKIVIGDNVYIGADVQIICDEFTILDYSKVHHHTNFHGTKPLRIGYNCWIGQYTIIDSMGGTTMGNNCGIGAHSQLWSHIMFGDTMEGCRFKSEAPLQIRNDVWFVGHCIVSPITAEDRSMALTGSVVTKDMKYNEIYAGTPAKSVSDKMGNQFKPVSIEEKMTKMNAYLNEWGGDKSKIKIMTSHHDSDIENDISYFNVAERTYTKKQTDQEISFMKFLLPYRAKFIPQVNIQ